MGNEIGSREEAVKVDFQIPFLLSLTDHPEQINEGPLKVSIDDAKQEVENQNI